MAEKTEAEIVEGLAVAVAEPRSIGPYASPFLRLPQQYHVHNMESTLPVPVRKRGTVIVKDVDSFVRYYSKHKAPGDIYATSKPPQFIGVLNGHTEDVSVLATTEVAAVTGAGWGDHRVAYKCPHSDEWVIWTSNSGKRMSQTDFAEFIDANVTDIRAEIEGETSGAQMLEVATNFRANTKVDFASGTRLSNGNVDFQYVEKTEATGGTPGKGSIKVPEVFFIGIPVFENDQAYKIEAKLRYRLEAGKLQLWYELVRIHVILEDAFKGVWAAIKEGTEADIYRGEPPGSVGP